MALVGTELVGLGPGSMNKRGGGGSPADFAIFCARPKSVEPKIKVAFYGDPKLRGRTRGISEKEGVGKFVLVRWPIVSPTSPFSSFYWRLCRYRRREEIWNFERGSEGEILPFPISFGGEITVSRAEKYPPRGISPKGRAFLGECPSRFPGPIPSPPLTPPST